MALLAELPVRVVADEPSKRKPVSTFSASV
jgi:hypothetical protein